MDAKREALVDRLYQEGLRHDEAEPDRLRRYRNLEPDAAALLAMLVRAIAARSVLEIGTSNGYSTIWLADAVTWTGGRVTSVDNVLSHPDEVAPLVRLIEADPELASTTVAVGKGELLAVRRPHTTVGTSCRPE